MKTVGLPIIFCVLVALSCSLLARESIRVGIIGLDTSHVIAFTEILNDENNPNHVPGARVVAAVPGGSPDIPASTSHVEGYTKELRERFQVEIVSDISALCAKVDAVLLESVDGRPHLNQLRPVIAARKPVFIDKPLAGSLKDALEIARLVKDSGVPCFSASSLRFFPGVTRLKHDPGVGSILGCDVQSPCATEPHHPDLYWYGVHGVEMLFMLMGPGCDSVTRVASDNYDIVVGKWADGRLGTFRGIRKGAQPFGATVFGEKRVKASDPIDGTLYSHLVREIVQFFVSGVPPVRMEETVETIAFMSAADESKRRGGVPVKIADVMASPPRENTPP